MTEELKPVMVTSGGYTADGRWKMVPVEPSEGMCVSYVGKITHGLAEIQSVNFGLSKAIKASPPSNPH